MTKSGFVKNVARILRENGVRKTMPPVKKVLHMSDDEGNARDFVVKVPGGEQMFTIEDINNIVESCLYVISEALKKGDTIAFRGFGSIGLRLRKARRALHPITKEMYTIPPHYVPKLMAGDELKMCAKVRDMTLKEQQDYEDARPQYEDTVSW